MQKLDKVAIVAAAVVLLGGVVFTFVGADPGKASAEKIQDYDEKITATMEEQQGLPRETPNDIADSIRDQFDVAAGAELDGWNFYRRPAIYKPTIVIEDIPPALSEGVICSVETLREKPSKVYQRIRGISGSAKAASMTREVVEMRAEGGEWVEVGTISVDGAGDSFELSVVDELERGMSYQYRLVSTAKTAKLMFPNGQPSNSITSGESDLVAVPRDLEWECTQAQAGGLGSDGQVQPGRATITRFTWDWDKMKVARKQAFGVEGDGKNLFDTQYKLDLIRVDTNPFTIVLRAPGRGNLLKLKLGERAPTLETESWTSPDSACGGDGGEETSSGSGSGANQNAGSGSGEKAAAKPRKPPPADDDDDIFGDDD